MIKKFTLIPVFVIFILALSACAHDPELPVIEIRMAGNSNNIAGRNGDVIRGTNQQFIATLVQNGTAITPAPTFDWEIVDNTANQAQRNATAESPQPPGVSVTDNGFVSIAAGVPLAYGSLRLNVTASHGKQVISSYIIINVIPLPPLIIPSRAHEVFQDRETGTWWRVLLPDDGNGNALIITEYVHMLNTRYHDSWGFTLFQLAEASSNLRHWWNNDWVGNGITASPHEQNVIGSLLRARALNYEFQDDFGASIPRTSTTPDAGIEVERSNDIIGVVPVNTNIPRGHTRPIANSNVEAEPFILSASEANHYFSGSTGAHGRRTQKFNDASNHASWWLRSPSFNTSAAHHAFVNSSGNLNANFATSAWSIGGFRPALWIQR